MVTQKASDLHLKPMRPPLLRLEERLLPVKSAPLSPQDIEKLILATLTPKQKAHLDKRLYVDFGYSLAGISRFRATVFYQRGTISAVFRRIPFDFPSLDDWGLPHVLYQFCYLPQGLILVTGPTGSGKSSTLAAMILEISNHRPVHVVTIEDPIEFLFRDGMAAITQREVGEDAHSFAQALKNTLRQDPDVIMIGEMRDPETIMTAMTAAETGHLVLSTLHTNSAAQTIDRIIDSFPEGQHRQIRIQLSQVLKATISLKLVPRCDQTGLIAAVEILRENPKVQKCILEGTIPEIDEEVEKSVAYYKMQSMNQSLISLVLNNAIRKETALAASTNPGELDMELRKFLYQVEHGTQEEGMEDWTLTGEKQGGDMAEPLSDFSKIVELQEIKKLYDEARDRHGRELAEKDETIQHLEEDLKIKSDEIANLSNQVQSVNQDREKLKQQVAFTKNELEGKIARLQERIQQLTAAPAVQAAEKGKTSGFFRK
ncbi:PilT/PilU family type 4a pilus ATPase [bacterium]|nr:PilT/PilU family type 4a pilus ATPase [bacterium]